MAIIRDFEEFVEVHALLLAASGIPSSLHELLYQKLSSDTFDGGDFFQVEPCEDGRQRRLVLTADSMDKESQVFLVDHAWTFRLSDALKQLQEVPGLAQRMASLMCVDLDLASDTRFVSGSLHESNSEMSIEAILEREVSEAKEKYDGIVRWLELDELGIDDDILVSLDLPRKFPVYRSFLFATSTFCNSVGFQPSCPLIKTTDVNLLLSQ